MNAYQVHFSNITPNIHKFNMHTTIKTQKMQKKRARCFAPSIDWTFVGPWASSHSILVEWTWVEVFDNVKKNNNHKKQLYLKAMIINEIVCWLFKVYT